MLLTRNAVCLFLFILGLEHSNTSYYHMRVYSGVVMLIHEWFSRCYCFEACMPYQHGR
ncbi:hypothetical protein PVAP13_8KG098368 [Panicum virgatum]|uniref:Uncharacterized protein n=1 Tax=Panicum virgatum TaxID=38727 RepID=A0A8T0PN93_PANVG|nr:hypothetical protein PVAP13_8KG098368 [Panicum virgatum]